jgi:cupin 2 domain-containing protein
MPNIYEDIPKNIQEELFEEILKSKNVKIERIVSDGHTSPKSGWYDSVQNEWVIVLQGEAILSFENETDVALKRGDHHNIPAHKRHKVSHTSQEEKTIWLAVYY